LRSVLRTSYPRGYRITAKRLDPKVFTGLPLTLIAVTALYTLFLAASLVQALFAAQSLVRVDEAVNAFVAPYRIETLVQPFIWITDLGASPTLIAIALVATGFLWAHRRSHLIMPLWVTVAGSQATTWIGKFYFHRDRPDFILDVTALSPSFPSGHTTGAMAIYGFVAYAIARDLGGLRGRYEVVFWTAILITLIGFSRVFLSVHFATDVAAGWLVGGFWLLVGAAIAEHRRPRTGEAQETITR
jgi:undecaprenyl-diphosphatase